MFVTYVVDMADDIDDLLDEVEASFVKKQDSPKKLSKTLSSSNKIKEYVMSILFWIYKFWYLKQSSCLSSG